MGKMRTLECGCTWDDGQIDSWKPCPSHAGSSLYKVRKAHAEVISKEEIDRALDRDEEDMKNAMFSKPTEE